MRNLKHSIFVAVTLMIAVDGASADPWAQQMVAARKIDFGVIATGSEAKKLIEVKNVYAGVVHISNVSTTCGCSAATTGKQTLQPGESTYVEVQMNTQKFSRRKDSNLIIVFDSPRFAELRIPISAYIRTDVVISPGLLNFGEIENGNEGTAVVDIAYAGRSDWNIVDIKFGNKNIKATLSPAQRTAGQVRFRLTLTLSGNAKAGRIRDRVTIVTNDRTNPYVPLMVDGLVTSEFTIIPRAIDVGVVPAGKTATKQIVVKGKTPFTIDSVSCEGMADCFRATIRKDAKKIHSVPIEFVAPNRPGKFSEQLIVKINGREELLRLNVTGTIVN
ncbi:MAG TPA: DUF1573 domain-containing protein [Planctomycetes bacterium]|nr:DUF1573 domain-containing protein [Fuerstiella sp.]HIK92826.1 DUF1573 domain-containing protein [Planctomycetota bacterium]